MPFGLGTIKNNYSQPSLAVCKGVAPWLNTFLVRPPSRPSTTILQPDLASNCYQFFITRVGTAQTSPQTVATPRTLLVELGSNAIRGLRVTSTQTKRPVADCACCVALISILSCSTISLQRSNSSAQSTPHLVLLQQVQAIHRRPLRPSKTPPHRPSCREHMPNPSKRSHLASQPVSPSALLNCLTPAITSNLTHRPLLPSPHNHSRTNSSV